MTRLKTTALAVVVAVVAGVGPPVMAQTSIQQGTQPTIQQLVGVYAAAWVSRDPERISALHTPDTVFDLRIDGEKPAVGRPAVRTRFASILHDNPTYSSTVRKVGFGPDFVVIEYDIAMAPPAPFVLGRFRYIPTGTSYTVPAIDVIHFRSGLVSEKVTFLDVDTIRAKSDSVEPAGIGE